MFILAVCDISRVSWFVTWPVKLEAVCANLITLFTDADVVPLANTFKVVCCWLLTTIDADELRIKLLTVEPIEVPPIWTDIEAILISTDELNVV